MGDVKAEIEELKKLRDRLAKLEKGPRVQKFCKDCSKELAARLLQLLVGRNGRTPVDTGYLRHGWTGGEEKSARAYAKSCPLYKNGDVYTILVQNPVEYAPYVEFGHRTRDKKGWVKGQFFLTLAEDDLRAIAPRVLERKLEKFLMEVFSDG